MVLQWRSHGERPAPVWPRGVGRNKIVLGAMMSRLSPAAFVFVFAALEPAQGQGPAADQENLIEFENARAQWTRELALLRSERDAKLSALRETHRGAAERGRAAATKKGDLRLALAWERLAKELQPEAALVQEPKPGEADPKEVEAARSDCAREAAESKAEFRRKLRALREKRRKSVEQSMIAATKRGDLELALAWQEFHKELHPPLVNLARAAQTAVSGQIPENPKERLVDGILTSEVDSHEYWFAGFKPGTHWARFELGGAKLVQAVRIHVPLGVKWYANGHEPLDYEVLLNLGGKVNKRASVRDGLHPKRQVSADGMTQRIEIDLRAGIEASQLEFACTRTSGRNWAPVVFEIEILGEE